MVELTTIPTATDQVYLRGTSDSAGGFWMYGSGSGGSSGTYRDNFGWADQDSNAFLFWNTEHTVGVPYFGWFLDPVVSALDSDDYPYVCFAYGYTSVFTTAQIGAGASGITCQAYFYDSVSGFIRLPPWMV